MIMLRMTPSRRRQLLFQSSNIGGSGRKAGTHLGEAVGEVAAVCCCCPCGLANFMFLIIYKFPASLCRRVLHCYMQRRKQRLASKESMDPVKCCGCNCCDDFGVKIHPEGDIEEVMKKVKGEDFEEEQDKDVVKLEKEMWEKFYNTGFWRSCSRREDSLSPSQRIFGIVSVAN